MKQNEVAVMPQSQGLPEEQVIPVRELSRAERYARRIEQAHSGFHEGAAIGNRGNSPLKENRW